MISTKPTTGVITTISENKKSSNWKKWRGSLGDKDPENWFLLWFFGFFFFFGSLSLSIYDIAYFWPLIQAVNRLLSNSYELERIQIPTQW